MSTNASAPKSAPATRKGAVRPQAKGNASRKPLVRPAPRSKVRRARLVVAKVDTWSVAKLIFLLSVALGIVTVVSSVILWLVMQATGAFDGINELITMLGTTGNSVEVQQVLTLGQVALFSTILSVINVVLFTLLGVIAAMLYNVAAKLVGGIGVTLTDD
ncbi:DUF3566 domain-containing protein [Microbacterium foliorum]|uniref:DUF3566 domain-containing protein n=1 Tax=Rothia terrae TaxID=396015 RepID=UPI001D14A6D1|nr:DUF3566 domain-containing protein [Rothia terrae]MDT0190598.1 DUF3566 domain-containing protein [Rothia terrae]